MEIYGIDVSKHQGEINWGKVSDASNVDFAMIRCGYRGNETGKIVRDSQFIRNIEGAIDRDIPVGIYFYSQSISQEEAAEEASWVIDQIREYRIDYPVCFDFEGIGENRVRNVSKEERMAFAISYLRLVEQAGYTPMMYASQYGFKKMWNVEPFVDNGFGLWCAKYPGSVNDDGSIHPSSKPSIGHSYQMWQYSRKGKIAGINTDVDLDVYYASDADA